MSVKAVVRAAERCRLAVCAEPVAKELYGVTEIVLDTDATLRRVAMLYRGTGRYTLTPDERSVALDVVDARFERERGQ